MLNLILFIQSFPYMFVRFNVRVECKRLVKNYEEQANSRLAHNLLASGQLTKGHMRNTCWKLKSQVPESISWLISQLGQLVRCTASMLSVLSSFLYSHYKSPHCPQNCKETFRGETLEIHLRVRDCKPTIIYIFLYSYLSNYKSLRGY